MTAEKLLVPFSDSATSQMESFNDQILILVTVDIESKEGKIFLFRPRDSSIHSSYLSFCGILFKVLVMVTENNNFVS